MPLFGTVHTLDTRAGCGGEGPVRTSHPPVPHVRDGGTGGVQVVQVGGGRHLEDSRGDVQTAVPRRQHVRCPMMSDVRRKDQPLLSAWFTSAPFCDGKGEVDSDGIRTLVPRCCPAARGVIPLRPLSDGNPPVWCTSLARVSSLPLGLQRHAVRCQVGGSWPSSDIDHRNAPPRTHPPPCRVGWIEGGNSAPCQPREGQVLTRFGGPLLRGRPVWDSWCLPPLSGLTTNKGTREGGRRTGAWHSERGQADRSGSGRTMPHPMLFIPRRITCPSHASSHAPAHDQAHDPSRE